MPTGKVKFYDSEKGFGFLQTDEGEEVFLHASALPAGTLTLKNGTRCEFGVADGKKHLVKVPLTRHNSIPTMGTGCDGAASVLMRPAAPGTGVIAGGSIRTVLELAGVKNVLAKRLGSKTPLNNARATMVALRGLRTHQDTAKERGIPLEQIYS